MKVPAATHFSANYRRYTPQMSDALMRIATALGEIRSASVLPAVADQLRVSARVGTIHYSNLIEGNELPMLAAERAASGRLDADSRAKIELVNYVSALDLIDERLDAGGLTVSIGFLKELHGVVTRGLGRDDDPHFMPRHEGEWRDGVAIVQDRLTGKTMHEGPAPEEVPLRMASMFDWLQAKLDSGEQPVFVLAGVVHYGITDIHPFADGNGRVARLCQVALLMLAGALPGRMFSFERFYAEDRPAYYAALRSVREQTMNMESWLHYFLIGLVEEYERVAEAVADLGSMMWTGDFGPLRLSPGQERALTALRIQGRREFSRRDYEQAGRVGRSTAGSDLSELVGHGLLVLRGSGSATRYAFSGVAGPAAVDAGRGRPVVWTEAAIEKGLREFLAGHPGWPSPAEFRAAGRGGLYAAASRNGGIGRWRRIIGM